MLDLAQIAFTIIYSITVPDNCQSCPTYEELNLIYPDNTDKSVSGEIIDNKREWPNIQNEWKWYKQQNYPYVIYYDPPPDIVNRSYHITIQPTVPTYKLNQGVSNNLNMTENKVVFASDRWVGNNCGSASISAKLWASLLGDTMNYMKNNCDDSQTIFNANTTYTYSNAALTKEENSKFYLWQLDLQNYIQKWIDSILRN